MYTFSLRTVYILPSVGKGFKNPERCFIHLSWNGQKHMYRVLIFNMIYFAFWLMEIYGKVSTSIFQSLIENCCYCLICCCGIEDQVRMHFQIKTWKPQAGFVSFSGWSCDRPLLNSILRRFWMYDVSNKELKRVCIAIDMVVKVRDNLLEEKGFEKQISSLWNWIFFQENFREQ